MSVDPAASALALLERHRESGPETGHGALVLAAAAAVAEKAQPGSAAATARGLAGSPDAVIVAAGAELATGRCRDLVEEMISAVPEERRLRTFEMAEDFLASIDPLWAWSFLAPWVPPSHASLGLSVAAHADLRGLPSDFLARRTEGKLFARQLAADRTARAGIMGKLRGKEDAALKPLLAPRPASEVGPTGIPCYVAAATGIDPLWGMEVYRALEQNSWFEEMEMVLPFLVPRVLAAGGLALLHEALAARAGDLGEDRWLDAMHEAGALGEEDAVDRAIKLAEYWDENSIPEDELRVARFVFPVFARAGRGDLVARWALRWRVRLPILVPFLFPLKARVHRVVESRALEAFAEHPDDNWPTKLVHGHAWWVDAGPAPRARLDAAYDVLAVATAVPWLEPPGSFLDVIGAARPWPGSSPPGRTE